MKHKDFIAGLTIGILAVSSIVIADNIYNIYPNPYKILVNGKEASIEGYNVNDYSYFKLRDIGEQIGFTVDFKEDTIMINTEEEQKQLNDMSTSALKNEDIFNFVTINGVDYISTENIMNEINDYKRKITSDVAHEDFFWQFVPCVYYVFDDRVTDVNNTRCVLNKVSTTQRDDEGRMKLLEQYKMNGVFIDPKHNDYCYLTRDVFEEEVLSRVLQ